MKTSKIVDFPFNRILPHTAIVREDIYSGVIISVKVLPDASDKKIPRVRRAIQILFARKKYFWLPFKTKVNPNKYGIAGSKARKKFANNWFQINIKNPLYRLSEKQFKHLLLNKSSDYVNANIKISFLPEDLIKVSSKPLKRELDTILTIK